MQTIIFDNKLSAKVFFLFAGYILIFSTFIFFVYWLDAIICGSPIDSFQWLEQKLSRTVKLLVFATIYLGIALTSIYRNQYRIMGNNLIIKEQMFFFTTINATIPLSTLNEVNILRSFSHPMKHILLRTENATYDLYCITFRNELYNYLVNRINEKTIHSNLFFYKQKKYG